MSTLHYIFSDFFYRFNDNLCLTALFFQKKKSIFKDFFFFLTNIYQIMYLQNIFNDNVLYKRFFSKNNIRIKILIYVQNLGIF